MLNIGIDLDDTINNLAIGLMKSAKEYNQKNNINHNVKENEWDFDKAFGWDDSHTHKFLTEYVAKIMIGAEPKEGAVEVITKLKSAGNKIIIITARSESHAKNAYDISEKWLNKYNIPHNKLVINSYNKAKKCKENNIDIFIDDNMGHCENVYNTLKIPTYIFDSIYNKKDNNENIKRIFSWEEFYEEINKKM